MSTVKVKALVKNIKRERLDLAEHFSEYALTEIAKDKIAEYPRFANDIGFLTVKCIASMENQLNTAHEDQKEFLQNCPECDCGYPLEVIAEMTPRQKISNYLIWNGIEGFTDDILDAVSAAYGIILEPDLNRQDMATVGKAFRKCLPEDKNSCVNCDNCLTCPLAVSITNMACLKPRRKWKLSSPVTEKLISRTDGRKLYSYNIRYENPGEKPVSFYFYTRTRIMAFIQHENEVMNLTAEMREITQHKPILCLESHTRLFRSALDSIMEAYSKGEYSDEDLRKEYCPDVTEVYTDWMRYEFRCSDEYEAYMLMVGDVEGNNVCNATDAAWNWFHTGFVNNFISRDLETHSLNLNW